MAHALEDDSKKEKKIEKNAEHIEEILETAPPPDGGWGWAVVFASFMIHVVTDGVTYSFGVIHNALLKEFKEGEAATSWISSILVGTTLCSGPICSIFVNKYGCRAVTITGAIVASMCLLASVFMESITCLYFTLGLGTGIGFGLIYLPAIVSVSCYFEKLRSLATGIAVCGSGLGTFAFSPLLNYLVESFGWRGTLTILAVIVLNCIFFGILFRPLELVRKPIEMEEIVKKSDAIKLVVPEVNGLSKNGFTRPHSVSNVNNARYHLVGGNDDSENVMRFAMSQPTLAAKIVNHHTEQTTHTFGSGIMNRKDVFYQGSVDNIRRRSASLGYHDMKKTKNHESRMSLPNGTGQKEDEKTGFKENAMGAIEFLKEMLDISLMKDPVFLLYVFSNFCTSIGFNVPYVFLIQLAKDRHLSERNASYLLGVIGIANTFARIILGYISDKPWINRLALYNICLTICGISTVLSIYCSSFTEFSIYASFYGCTIGAYVGLTSVILVDLLGLDRLTNAFGLLLFFQGVASFLGPPLAGFLADQLKSYEPGFIVAGVMIGFSGLILFFIPMLVRRQKSKEVSHCRINNVS